MTHVLITGAGGFIGSHLVADQLKKGHKVTAVDIHTQRLNLLHSNENLHIIEGSFADAHLLDSHLPGHDVCFHLASAHLETGVDDSYFWKINVEGAEDFVRRCHQAGIPRFVHCSSVGVFGDLKNPPANEESECHPDVAYEKSKLAGEEAIQEYMDKTNYSVAIIRPAWVYGPHCPRTARLFRSISKGSFFFVGDGQTLRHPIYIDDMVEGFEVAATHDSAPGQVFIMAGPRAVTLAELTGEIARCLGKPAPSLKIPKVVIYPAAYAAEVAFSLIGRDAPVTRRSLKFFTGNTAFSTQKAERHLGYKAKVDLVEGLTKTHAWLQANGQV